MKKTLIFAAALAIGAGTFTSCLKSKIANDAWNLSAYSMTRTTTSGSGTNVTSTTGDGATSTTTSTFTPVGGTASTSTSTSTGTDSWNIQKDGTWTSSSTEEETDVQDGIGTTVTTTTSTASGNWNVNGGKGEPNKADILTMRVTGATSSTSSVFTPDGGTAGTPVTSSSTTSLADGEAVMNWEVVSAKGKELQLKSTENYSDTFTYTGGSDTYTSVGETTMTLTAE